MNGYDLINLYRELTARGYPIRDIDYAIEALWAAYGDDIPVSRVREYLDEHTMNNLNNPATIIAAIAMSHETPDHTGPCNDGNCDLFRDYRISHITRRTS